MNSRPKPSIRSDSAVSWLSATSHGSAMSFAGSYVSGLDLREERAPVPGGGEVLIATPIGGDPHSLIATSRDRLLVISGCIYEAVALDGRRSFDPSSKPDSKDLLESIIEVGLLETVASLRGRFVILYVDAGAWHLVRDQTGEEQLYASRGGGGIRVSSSLGHLVRWLGDRSGYISDLTSRRYFETPIDGETSFRGVTRLERGSIVRVVGEVETTLRYWHRSSGGRRFSSEAEARSALSGALYEATRRRVEGRFGGGRAATFLSGGQDSSYVAGLAHQLTPELQKGYSAAWANLDSSYNEARWASVAAERSGLLHEIIQPDDNAFERDYPTVMRILSEPKANAAHYLEFCIAAAAHRDGFEALLSGYGSDECLGGEVRYLIGQLASYDYEALLSSDDSLLQPYRALVERLKQLPRGASLLDIYWALSVRVADVNDRPADLLRVFQEEFERSAGDGLAQMEAIDQRISVPPLLESTQLLKFWGIEKLCPFLDPDVQVVAAAIPSSMKVVGSTTKKILRDISDGIVPAEITARTDKVGFAFPHFLPEFDRVISGWTSEAAARGVEVQLDPSRGRYDRAKLVAASEHLVRTAFDSSY